MITKLKNWNSIKSEVVNVEVYLISLAVALVGGLMMSRLTKLVNLPAVTAYLVAGLLLGPFCIGALKVTGLGFNNADQVEAMKIVTQTALGFIAFTMGNEFRLSSLKKTGKQATVIAVFQAVTATLFVDIALIGLHFIIPEQLPLAAAITLGAIASATAPASTVMTIRQTHAKGDFVDTLLQVVALDDVVGLVAYSIAISVALASGTGTFQMGSILKPIAVNILVLLLGGAFGFFLKLLLHKRSTDNRLIVSIALLFAFCGICAMLDVSPLLGCMSMGTVYINLTDDKRLFQQLNYFNPPILLLFFVRSGVNFDLGSLVNTSDSIGATPLVVVGILYFLVRIVGKYIGAFLGCLATKKDGKVRNYLGLALIPQAGVAIGLAATGARILGGEMGKALETIILASSVLYELIGPACAKLSLYLSGSYSTKLEDLAPIPAPAPGQPPKSEVELLIERIQAIQQELPRHNNPYYEDEEAFTEAAAEHSAQMESFFTASGRANPVMTRGNKK